MRIVRGTHSQSYYLDSIPYKPVLTALEAQLALLAFEQQMYVGDDEMTILKQIKKVLKDNNSKDRLRKLENRALTLKSPDKTIVCKTITDRVIYENCLRLAFTFNFKKLKEVLYNWEPNPEFAINKAVLLSLVDHDACCRILTSDMLEAIPTRIERFRATQLANILHGDLHGRFSTKITLRCHQMIYFLYETGSLVKVCNRKKGYNLTAIMTVLTLSMKRLHCEV